MMSYIHFLTNRRETIVTSQITETVANVELVRAAMRAFNAGDADGCLARMAPDFIINLAEVPGPQHGHEVWRQGFEMMRHAFPDLQAHIEDIVAAEDKVALRLRFRGTHSGEFLGFPATGRAVEYVSHEFYRVADGLIAEEWICSDMATLLGQLG
jgi:steroid delta-isomerase-like uncharacterized protein